MASQTVTRVLLLKVLMYIVCLDAIISQSIWELTWKSGVHCITVCVNILSIQTKPHEIAPEISTAKNSHRIPCTRSDFFCIYTLEEHWIWKSMNKLVFLRKNSFTISNSFWIKWWNLSVRLHYFIERQLSRLESIKEPQTTKISTTIITITHKMVWMSQQIQLRS